MEDFFGLLLHAGLDAAAFQARMPVPQGRLYSGFDLNDVIEQMTRRIDADEADQRARFLRGIAYQAQERYALALADFNLVLSQDPAHAGLALARRNP